MSQTAKRFVDTKVEERAIPPSTAQIMSQLNWEQSSDVYLANIDPANADYRTATINQNDTLQTLAYRLFGDHGRYPELILLNDLKYPYIASKEYIEANNLTNVIPYGGTLLFPVKKETTKQRLRTWRNENARSLSLLPFERALGSDIRVSQETGDVVWENNDLALTYGVDNVEQFIRKRLLMTKGIYRRAITMGFSKLVGVSTGVPTAVVKAESRALFADDPRISSSEAIDIREDAGSVYIAIRVKVRDIQDPLIITQEIEI